MTDRNGRHPGSAEKTVRDIRRVTRRKFSAEDKIHVVLEGLHGEKRKYRQPACWLILGGNWWR